MDRYVKVMEKPEGVKEAPISDGYWKLYPETLRKYPKHPEGDPIG